MQIGVWRRLPGMVFCFRTRLRNLAPWSDGCGGRFGQKPGNGFVDRLS